VFRQLVARGLVSVDFDGYGALQLTDTCRPILRGEQQLMLRKDVKPEKIKATKSGQATGGMSDLWDALRAKRKQIADAQDVPPYVIFHDATLMAMMEAKPANLRDMARISGIGTRKLEQYGEQFLEVLQRFRDAEDDASDTVSESVKLIRLGFSVSQTAQKRSLRENTIYTHMAQALEQGMVLLSDVVDLPEAELKTIEAALLDLPEEQKNALKPIFDQFAGQYSYEVLRCIRAALWHRVG
jgi:ATP-dependent DNA helicase RecQ